MKRSYVKRRFILVATFVTTCLLIICLNLFGEPKPSKTVILHENDKSVFVSKGTKIEGNAVELIYLDNNQIVVEIIETPAVADRLMSVKCAEGETSECILSN